MRDGASQSCQFIDLRHLGPLTPDDAYRLGRAVGSAVVPGPGGGGPGFVQVAIEAGGRRRNSQPGGAPIPHRALVRLESVTAPGPVPPIVSVTISARDAEWWTRPDLPEPPDPDFIPIWVGFAGSAAAVAGGLMGGMGGAIK